MLRCLHIRPPPPPPQDTLDREESVDCAPLSPTPSDDILPSKFSDKLNTNYIPHISEIADINQFVASVNVEVSQFDIQIAELETSLQRLTNRRIRLQDVANAHKALVSPFRRLPPELLQHIFGWCLPYGRNAVMHASEAPVLLGRVCSEWRRISLATPELWSSLHIVPPNVNFTNPTSSTTRFQRKQQLIEMWLSRSGACSLNISFVWFSGDSEDEIKLCGLLLEVLVPLCSRWRVLDFQIPLKMFKPFIGLTVKNVPLLEGLSLMDNRTPLTDTDAVDHWPESLSFVESAPGLRTFTLTLFAGGIRLPSIPWSQITTLYLESNIAFFFEDSQGMLTALQECTSLETCTLKFPLSHTATLPAYKKLNMPITLPELRTLGIDGDQHLHNTFHMTNTLINLCTPKLHKLEIIGRSGRTDSAMAIEPLAAIRGLLERSKCPLERMSVESMTLIPEEFIGCLKAAPTLVELIVHNWAVRMNIGQIPEEEMPDLGAISENVVLKALTLLPMTTKAQDAGSKTSPSSENGDQEAWVVVGDDVIASSPDGSASNSHFFTLGEEDPDTTDHPILCPNLQRFDFNLCDASQSLLCDFVASRWDALSLPPGVTRIKTVKCNFTTAEEEGAKLRIQKFRSEGLDAFLTYQVPIVDDLNPSPWTGLEGPLP